MGPKAKKRKRVSNAHASHAGIDASHAGIDASLLSIAITSPAALPPSMKKYWWNRHTLFSLFSQGVLLDRQSWYSVTPEPIAYRIATRCSCTTVVDAFCGAGGNAIQLALTCHRVIAIDIDENKIRLAKHNAAIYGVEDRITFCVGDYVEFVKDAMRWRQQRSNTGADAEADGDGDGDEDAATDSQGAKVSRWQGSERLDIDVVFLSPPWGGVGYINPGSLANRSPAKPSLPTSTYSDLYSLSLLAPLPGKELFELTSNLTRDIAFYLPRNTDLDEIAALATPVAEAHEHPTIHIEEQRLGTKLSAITCYFGNLASQWDDERDTWKEGVDRETETHFTDTNT
ncbi:putative diacylglycerol O-acyltransferase tgs1 [Thecaphora frezii]